MEKKMVLLFTTSLALFLLVSGCSTETAPVKKETAPEPPTFDEPGIVKEEVKAVTDEMVSPEVEITSTGFKPRTLTIAVGDTVTWTNKDSAPHWPATNLHPTHTQYPGSTIAKCKSPQEGTIFDACKRLADGEKFSFTFTDKGSWNYHDHVKSSFAGTIIVE
jgi:plastocyanin